MNRINHQIRAPELRVIGANGENLGVLTLSQALMAAEQAGLDLIEISPLAVPPVAKIADLGKFQYTENKKKKTAKAKSHKVETKAVQLTIGTGEHDLALKAKRASEWLVDGQRIKIDLFLKGREKYLPPPFLRERLERVLKFISTDYKITEPIKKSMKGFSMTIEKK
ncbi:MAG: translation initiation factor IF-3 [Candidatus Paceibacterota bacterium]